MKRATTISRADLGYVRDRDEGRCRVGKFTPPRWCAISPQMRPNEVEKAIRKCTTISPQFKAVYLAMLDAGANANGSEVRHG